MYYIWNIVYYIWIHCILYISYMIFLYVMYIYTISYLLHHVSYHVLYIYNIVLHIVYHISYIINYIYIYYTVYHLINLSCWLYNHLPSSFSAKLPIHVATWVSHDKNQSTPSRTEVVRNKKRANTSPKKGTVFNRKYIFQTIDFQGIC